MVEKHYFYKTYVFDIIFCDIDYIFVNGCERVVTNKSLVINKNIY